MKNSPFYETLDGRAAITNRLQLIKDNSLTGRNYERNKNECPLIVPSKHAFINRYLAKLFVFWEKIIHAQLLNVADDGFSYL